MAELRIFSDAEHLARSAAARIEVLMKDAIAARGRAQLVLPGGRTPAVMLGKLAQADLDWSSVTATLCDERWVDPLSPDSNEAMLRRHLLVGAADALTFLPLYNGAASPAAAIPVIEAHLRALPPIWDVVTLGMGDDGHFASLFPGEAELAIGLDRASARLCVAAIGPAGGPPRLSLTLACLARARQIFILASGETKRRVWEAAAAQGPLSQPVAALQMIDDVPVELLWCP